MATSFSGGGSQEYPERTTDHGQATGKLYHLRLRVESTLFVIYKADANPRRIGDFFGQYTTFKIALIIYAAIL